METTFTDQECVCVLREVRERKGFEQKSLVSATRLPQSTISSIERQERFPTRRILTKLCAALKCSPGDLIAIQPKKTSKN